mgnify:CR=1 FL=1
MYVKNIMTTDVVTIFKDASVDLAFQTMVEKGCKQLPVVDKGQLIGAVTEHLLADVTPSKATTLSMYELNYLLSKTKVRDIMVTDMPVGSPDMLIEEAVVQMKLNNVDSLPIVEGKKLVGIITRTDILESFLELTGINDTGTRISLRTKNETGILANIANIIKEHNINIIHVANYNHIGDNDDNEIIIRLATLDTTEVIQSLEDAGYEVLNIRTNE